MNIFYGKSKGRPDVPCETPVEASLETVLAVFRALEPKRGFLGVQLDERYVVQLLTDKRGTLIELLDTALPAFERCCVDSEFAESLIRAATEGRDVFEIARAGHHEWEHWDLPKKRHEMD